MFGVGVSVESSLGLLRIIIFFLLLVGDLKEDFDLLLLLKNCFAFAKEKNVKL